LVRATLFAAAKGIALGEPEHGNDDCHFNETKSSRSYWQCEDTESPFLRWLREQLLELHGIDLVALARGQVPDVLLEA